MLLIVLLIFSQTLLYFILITADSKIDALGKEVGENCSPKLTSSATPNPLLLLFLLFFYHLIAMPVCLSL